MATRKSPKKAGTAVPPANASPKLGSGMFSRPKRVLLADDLLENREMYALQLEYLGYRVIHAVDGRDAVEKATASRPDLIVMDLSMPVMDGWEATRRLKANPRTRDIPVLVLTSYGLGGHEEATKAGCDAYLVKPCVPEDLIGVVESLLATSALDAGRTG